MTEHFTLDELAELDMGLLDRALLTRRRAREATSHVADCEECSARADALRKTQESLRDLGPVQMPAEVAARLDRALSNAGTMTGDLTLHGVTKPVTLDVTFDGAGRGIGPLGTRLGFSGSTQIKRSDFGISNFVLNQFTGDDVDVIFEVEFEKK